MKQKCEEFKPDAELQALLDSMKESFEWEAEQLKMEGNKWDKQT